MGFLGGMEQGFGVLGGPEGTFWGLMEVGAKLWGATGPRDRFWGAEGGMEQGFRVLEAYAVQFQGAVGGPGARFQDSRVAVTGIGVL